MGSRVAVDLQGVGTFRGKNFQLRIGFERASEIEQFSIDASDDCIGGEARADRLGDVNGTRAFGHGLLAAIGQSDGEAAHYFKGNSGGKERSATSSPAEYPVRDSSTGPLKPRGAI